MCVCVNGIPRPGVTVAGSDVRSRLACILEQQGHNVAHYLSGGIKNASGLCIERCDDESGKRVWERAAQAALKMRARVDTGKRKFE